MARLHGNADVGGARLARIILVMLDVGNGQRLCARQPCLLRDIGGCPAAVLGVGLGYLHGRELAHGMRPGLFIGGAAISIALVLFYCATVVSSLRPIWAQIGVRVVGSWVVAISTLVLGLALR